MKTSYFNHFNILSSSDSDFVSIRSLQTSHNCQVVYCWWSLLSTRFHLNHRIKNTWAHLFASYCVAICYNSVSIIWFLVFKIYFCILSQTFLISFNDCCHLSGQLWTTFGGSSDHKVTKSHHHFINSYQLTGWLVCSRLIGNAILKTSVVIQFSRYFSFSI